MVKSGPKSPVTLRALIARINRKLKHEDQVLKTTRGQRGRGDLGDYYILNFNRNSIVGTHIDPIELGKEEGLLQKWEQVNGQES